MDSYVLVDLGMFGMYFILRSQVNATTAALEEIYGGDAHVVFTDGWGASEFEVWWNSKLPSDADAVIIISHGNHKVLQLDARENTGINMEAMGGLQPKENIDMLLLFGCDTGLMEYYPNNIAASFTQYVPNGRVIGVDGRRMYLPLSRMSKVEKTKGYNRDPMGYVYFPSNGVAPQSIYNPDSYGKTEEQIVSIHENSVSAANKNFNIGTRPPSGSERQKAINNRWFNIGSRPPSGYELILAQNRKS